MEGLFSLTRAGQKTLRKINKLIQDIERNGYECTGRPEPLKGNLSGY